MELLKSLYKIDSKSGQEQEMYDFISSYVSKNFPEAIIENDAKGNLYVTKGAGPLYKGVVSHIDEVHSPVKEKLIMETPKIIFGWNDTSQQGIGADDKNGIWICFQALHNFDNIKCAFFVEEETGCQGSSKCDLSFFDDCMYVLQCDRKGNSDFIWKASGTELCSEEFISDIDIKEFGYSKAEGMLTDVKTLKTQGLKVCCCNISCGYYNPHKNTEYTVKEDLEKCWKLVKHILTDLNKTYLHEYKPYTPVVTAPIYSSVKTDHKKVLDDLAFDIIEYVANTEIPLKYDFWFMYSSNYLTVEYFEFAQLWNELVYG